MTDVKTNGLIVLLDKATLILMYLWMFYVITVTVLLLMSSSDGFSADISHQWPVLFSDGIMSKFYSNDFEIFARPHDSDLGSLNLLSAELSPRYDLWPWFGLYLYLTTLIKYTLLVWVVFLFRKIIVDIKQQKPFTELNCRRLKYIALLLFSLFPYAIIDGMINHWYIINYVEMFDIEFVSRIFTSDLGAQSTLADNQILLANNYSISPIIYALIVYTIAVTFQEGLKLKHDSESII